MFKKELLIKVMEEKKITAYKLWKVSKVAQSTISTILNGNNLNPSTRTLEKIASALEVPMSSFFDDERQVVNINIDTETNFEEPGKVSTMPYEKAEINVAHSLTQSEIFLLSQFNKLNPVGRKEAIKRVAELTEINIYTESKETTVTDLINLTKEEPKSLEDFYTTIAAHDDDLTDNEKQEADKRILEALKKRQK